MALYSHQLMLQMQYETECLLKYNYAFKLCYSKVIDKLLLIKATVE